MRWILWYVTVAMVGAVITSRRDPCITLVMRQKHPRLVPVDALFPVVWTILYVALAYHAQENDNMFVILWFMIWRYSTPVVILHLLNGVLCVLWCWLFFRIDRPDLSLLVALLLCLTGHLLALLGRKNAFVVTPYVLWCAFAGILNAFALATDCP